MIYSIRKAKKILVIIILITSCTSVEKKDFSQEAEKAIAEVDIAMSDLAVKEGFYKALLQYAEDSVIIPREGKMPLIGIQDADIAWPDKETLKEISWKPFRVQASKSGDMGYTFGFWIYKGSDTTTYGNYCTIWRKQNNGSWKFVFDGGNSMPRSWE